MRLKNKTNLVEKEIMDVLEECSDTLRKYTVRRIGLVGSYVRGEQRKRSDIDFLVEFEQPTFDNFMDLIFFLEDLFGRNVDLITEKGSNPYLRPYVEKEVRWYEVQ